MVLHPLKSKQSGSAAMIAVVVIVLAVIGGAGAYVATGGFKSKDGDAKNSQQTQTKQKTIAANTPSGIQMLFAGAKAGDYDVKCTLNYDKAPASNKAALSVTGPATLYISGTTKMRIDMTISGKPGHFVRLGDSVYIWADGQTQGSKIPVTKKTSTTNDKYSTDSFAANAAAYDLKCQSVSHLDTTLFALPATVKFVDINSQFTSHSSVAQ